MGGKGTGISQEQERIFRINAIWDMFNKHPNWAKERLISEFQLIYGTSRRTTLDYIKNLINAKKISF